MTKTGLLTREGFERLLVLLDPDPTRAGERYELLRRKLVRFFEWHRGGAAEDQADRVLDRVSRRLAEGEVIRANDPSGYFFGVARNILHEHWDAQKRERRAIQSVRAAAQETVEPDPVLSSEDDAAHECLQGCLEKLPRDRRQLIVDYYRGERATKIRGRQGLAESLQIPPNALRLRAFRIRASLERCIRECVERRAHDGRRNETRFPSTRAVKRGEP